MLKLGTEAPEGSTWWPRWTTEWWKTPDWWGTTPRYGDNTPHWATRPSHTTTEAPYTESTTPTRPTCFDTPGTNCRRFKEAGLCRIGAIWDECKRSCAVC
uniref:ShKT domain-containing protein n=1 Tax=Steinernema glaseri TaxID=37863 RepID=A0A1I7Y4Z4_9BILA